MEPFTVTRLAYDGLNVDVMEVSTIAEYEAGCQEHSGSRCLGHLCKTPHGNMLPMQSLAVSTGVITNDVSKAARFAFEGPGQYYSSRSREVLLDSMKKKTGRMRKGILNCHVDGSLRMVITPQLDLGKEWVAVPKYLRDKWSVIYFDESSGKYKSRNIEHGDYALVIRPPSLSIRSVQPVRVTFWNETCLGISPYILKAFDGDYDGDEMHVFPVYSQASVQECMDWINTPNPKFDKAMDIYAKSKIPDKGSSQYSFMDHTTMSFEEIRSGAEQPILAEETRTTSEHIEGFRKRYDTESVNRSFISESIIGMADTNAQQLSQPVVGVMSRIAKLAASCVIHKDDDSICIATRTGMDFVSSNSVEPTSIDTTQLMLQYRP
ncbi:RNA polymerase rpb1 [Hirsutella rhossiliensis]|uniref:RNA polymerase rpb1 n=1 Tax=Hirsutella rhossiliensis TaxID=111463 RepID=A0A9P8SJB5_9HYPO|nr:RNA polymerase rpb1 [Hirsutella rhossiliensis]KAH0963530.1 RNA polymerase rpb1 [Hirsutella rhossiliensis]